MIKSNEYGHELRLIKSLLIVTSLKKGEDLTAKNLIEKFDKKLEWMPLDNLMIDEEIWDYAVSQKKYDPKFIFCHPEILLHYPITSLYYRGLCGLSQKAAKNYFGAVENLERGNPRARIDYKKAELMARTYNTFICSIIKNSTYWTLENGYRTIIATMGISLDGTMRNKIGDIAEERIKTLILEWLIDNGLIKDENLTKEKIYEELPRDCLLKKDVLMRFGSEPDISFSVNDKLIAVIEIKGGTDPAGALERYGAATKSFQHSIEINRRCKNFYLCAVFTKELKKRINEDRLVEKSFDIIKLIQNPTYRSDFFKEIFHHTLRLIQ